MAFIVFTDAKGDPALRTGTKVSIDMKKIKKK